MIKIVMDKINPAHVQIRVFSGDNENELALCGTLIMRPQDWEFLRGFIKVGIPIQDLDRGGSG